MRNLFLLFASVCMALSLYSCSETNSKIADAANAIEQNDYEKAQVLCDEVMKTQWKDLTIEDKCDLAVCFCALYTELSNNEEHNMASFRKCYESAMKEDPKTVRNYLDAADEDLHDAMKFLIEMDDLGKELEDWDF